MKKIFIWRVFKTSTFALFVAVLTGSSCSIEISFTDLRNKGLPSLVESPELGENVLIGWELLQLNSGAVILAKQDEWAERIALSNGAEVEVKRNF